MARRQLFRDGRVPEFLADPTETQRLQLAALVALRAGDLAETARQAEAAEAMRPATPGHHGDVAFDDLRDADDLLAGSFEVLTTTGKYFWIPTERVQTLEFHAPKRPRDLLWRRASMSVADGPDGEVYLPAIYAADDAMTDALRLGRETDWRQVEPGPVRGVGQRLFMMGDDAVTMMDLGNIRFGA
jgi:type VI secretion system protein ImpE